MNLFEDVYQKAVPASSLPVGEHVSVVTKMGSYVCSGIVTRVYGYGAVQIRSSEVPNVTPAGGIQSSGEKIYNSKLYMFIPSEIMPGDDVEEESSLREDEPKAQPEPETRAQSADKAASKKLKDSGIRSDSRSSKAKIDVDKLPSGLKSKLVGIDELDESQRDRVLSSISESALRALRDVGVKDSDIFEKVVAIQKAVSSAL